jgi:hypothetical protein
VNNNTDRVVGFLNARRWRGLLCGTIVSIFIACAAVADTPGDDNDTFIRKYTFDRSRFGTSPLPIWYELTDFERMALGRRDAARAGDPQALLALAIMASGDERSMEAWEKYREQIETFVRRIKPIVDQTSGQKAKGRIVFSEMCAAFFEQGTEKEGLRGYGEDQSRLTELLRTKRYNCVSSALLYIVCARYCGLTVKGVTMPSHIFVQLVVGREEAIDVETTSNSGFGIVHDQAFYDGESGEWYKKRKMKPSTWQDYLDRNVIEPYQVVAQNMTNQHTIEERMPIRDINRLGEASGYLDDTNARSVLSRLNVYRNECIYFDRVGDSVSMVNMFSRIGPLVHTLVRSRARDTSLTRAIADLLRYQYQAFLGNGRESDALALLPDAMVMLKTGDTIYASMMILIDRITSNRVAWHVETKQFERGLAFLDSYVPYMRPGNDLTNTRGYVLYAWARASREEKNWERAVALYAKAQAAIRDTAMADRVREDLALACLNRANELRDGQCWQQAAEMCSTAYVWARSAAPKEGARSNLLLASLSWSRQLIDSGAWAAALDRIQRTEPYAASDDDRLMLADERVYIHEAWAQAYWEKKRWKEALAQLHIALPLAGTSPKSTRVKDNIAGVHLLWMSDLWDKRSWQQIVERCSTAQIYAQSDGRKETARENNAGARVNWAHELASRGAWEAAIAQLQAAERVTGISDVASQCAKGIVSYFASWGEGLFDKRQWRKAAECFLTGLSRVTTEELRGPLRDSFHAAYMNWSGSPGAEKQVEARRKLLQQCADACADCAWCKVELDRLPAP